MWATVTFWVAAFAGVTVAIYQLAMVTLEERRLSRRPWQCPYCLASSSEVSTSEWPCMNDSRRRWPYNRPPTTSQRTKPEPWPTRGAGR